MKEQDVNNLAQVDYPMHEIEKSWMWCEKWCSARDFERAKIIDFCHNLEESKIR